MGAGAALLAGAFSVLGAAAMVPAGASTTTYSGNVTAAGLNISLFGNKLTGGNSTACFNHGLSTNKDANGKATACDGKDSPFAAASGAGTFLTGALSALASAQAGPATGSNNQGSDASPICGPISTGGPQGSSGVTIDGAISCAWAQASADSATGNSSATGYGELAHLNVDLAGILGQITGASPASSVCTQSTENIGALLNGICQVLGPIGQGAASAPAPIGGLFPGVEQALQNLYDVTTHNLPANTVTIAVGPAKSSVSTSGDGSVTDNAYGATLDVQVLPGVGCKAGVDLATCAANDLANITNEANNPTAAPLIELQVGPARCSATRNAAGQWSSTDYASIIDLDLNIPGDNIPIHIPGTAGTGQTIAGGTPLQSTIRIAAGSAAPVGDSAGCTTDSVTVSLLENSTFPGGSPTAGTGGAILVSTGSSTLSATNNTAATPTSQGGGGGGGTGSTPQATPTAAVVTSPTSVHTGEWWSGSMPLLVALAAIGGGLIGWPRIRRMSLVSRIVNRAGK